MSSIVDWKLVKYDQTRCNKNKVKHRKITEDRQLRADDTMVLYLRADKRGETDREKHKYGQISEDRRLRTDNPIAP